MQIYFTKENVVCHLKQKRKKIPQNFKIYVSKETFMSVFNKLILEETKSISGNKFLSKNYR